VEAAFDAVVLAGGAGRRLGGVDKAMLTIGGRPLLTRALEAVVDAQRLVVVGPARDLGPDGREPTWVCEEPPGGGPVAGLEAGLASCGADLVVVLACDQPRLTPSVVRELLDSVGDHDGCILTRDGRDQPLCAAYRLHPLQDVIGALPEVRGASLTAVLSRLRIRRLPDESGASMDIDEPPDLTTARAWAGG
jgi:molybdopterin-guanine dinucleotide biosynthesis protein A